MQKSNLHVSFSDIYIGQRKIKSNFFNQLDKLINWSVIEHEINQHYKKGNSVDGRKSYGGLVLFKMSLLQTWYGLSDYEVEAQVNDSLSFMKFTGLQLEDAVPDHSVLSRFRTAMTKAGAYERLFELINNQLSANNILVKKGLIVDASVTITERKPKGHKEYEIVEDRNEEQVATLALPPLTATLPPTTTPIAVKEKIKPGVDTEAAWLKKGGKLYYGYKKHISVEEDYGLVTSVISTAANESDMHHIIDVVSKAKPLARTSVKADKGYQSKDNITGVEQLGCKPQIMKKASKGKALGHWEKRYNQLISKKRFKVERVFGSMVGWFKAGKARYIGLAKTHTQHLMESIAYNLYRSPKIAITLTTELHLIKKNN